MYTICILNDCTSYRVYSIHSEHYTLVYWFG